MPAGKSVREAWPEVMRRCRGRLSFWAARHILGRAISRVLCHRRVALRLVLLPARRAQSALVFSGRARQGRIHPSEMNSAAYLVGWISVLTLPMLGQEAATAQAKQKTQTQMKQAFPFAPAPAKGSTDLAPVVIEHKERVESLVVMDKFTVTESMRLRDLRTAIARQEQDESRLHFRPAQGGQFFETKLGRLPVHVGLWEWHDVFAADAKLKPARTTIRVEFLRMKW